MSLIRITILSICLIVISMGVVGCASEKVNDQGEGLMAARTIEEVLKEHTEGLMSIPGVVGTAQGLCDAKPCIKVYVTNKTPELDQKIPKNLEGYPVEIEETGEIRALPKK